MKLYYSTGKDKCYRNMWTNNNDKQVRSEYYMRCFNELISIIDYTEPDIFLKRITIELKQEVWKFHFGENENAECHCGEIIYINNHHCGHIKARAKCGKTCIENLKPICSSCNLRMGTRNMD